MREAIVKDGGYEKAAHLYDLFDTTPNTGFFLSYAAQAKDLAA